MSDPKEPYFFDLHYSEGPEWYRKFFSHRSEEPIVGESSPSYFHNAYVTERMAETLDAPYFVVVLRDPIERAYSHWWMMRMHSGPKEEHRSFREAVRQNLAAIREQPELPVEEEEVQRKKERTGERDIRRDYIEIGHYAKHFERWFQAFPRDQFHILRSKDLWEHPQEEVEAIWRFLGTDPPWPEIETSRMNTSKTPGIKNARSVLQRLGVYRYWTVLPREMRERLKAAVSVFSEGRPPMDGDVRDELQEHYRPHNRRLEKLIDIDIHHWGA